MVTTLHILRLSAALCCSFVLLVALFLASLSINTLLKTLHFPVLNVLTGLLTTIAQLWDLYWFVVIPLTAILLGLLGARLDGDKYWLRVYAINLLFGLASLILETGFMLSSTPSRY